MLKLHNFFKNYSNFSKDYSPYLKTTEKSIENPSKNRNISLDFSNTPIKQNKKVIKRNTRTNSFNSLIINQTEGGLFPPYSYMTRINNGNGNKNTKINKDVIVIGANHQKNKSFNIKKGIFNLNKQNKTRKKNVKEIFLILISLIPIMFISVLILLEIISKQILKIQSKVIIKIT